MSSERQIIKALNHNITHLSPVDWGEANRYLTPEISRWPGFLRFDRTPYLREPCNTILESNPYRTITMMKGSQIGVSIVWFLTMMGWVIRHAPGNIMFIAKDDTAIKRMMQGPIDQMINNSNLAHLIGKSTIRRKRNGATGDTSTSKSFKGGEFYTWSGQTIGSLSELNIKYSFNDEVERYKGIDKDGGDFESLILARHKSYEDIFKAYFVSTPEIKQTSNIEPLYLKGDQKKYTMPCKCCGEMIVYEWSIDVENLKEKAGVYFKRDNTGKLIRDSVGYICQKCGGFFKETHKYDMLKEDTGIWMATAIPESQEYGSYHLPSLIAPPGMKNWTGYAQQWCEIYPKNKPTNIPKLQTFVNQTLAQTFDLPGSEIEIKQLMKNTRSYEIGIVPDALSQQDGNGKIVMLTCAVDLNGICGEDPSKDDVRLDYEVIAWSKSGSSYSIDHGSIGTFERSKTVRSGQAKKYQKENEDREKWTYRHNYQNSVWPIFEKEIMARVYLSDDQKKKWRIGFHGIDTGHFTQHAYEFVNKHGNVIALKGKVDNKYTKHDADKSFFKKSTTQDKLYLVEGDRIKNELNDHVQLVWSEDMAIDQPEGFMNFPNPDGKKYMIKSYFGHFEAERMEAEMNASGTAIGFRWTKRHSSSINHLFDCRVYNIALKHIFTTMVCKAAKVPVSWVNFMVLYGK